MCYPLIQRTLFRLARAVRPHISLLAFLYYSERTTADPSCAPLRRAAGLIRLLMRFVWRLLPQHLKIGITSFVLGYCFLLSLLLGLASPTVYYFRRGHLTLSALRFILSAKSGQSCKQDSETVAKVNSLTMVVSQSLFTLTLY